VSGSDANHVIEISIRKFLGIREVKMCDDGREAY